jgi:hypothetical protein
LRETAKNLLNPKAAGVLRVRARKEVPTQAARGALRRTLLWRYSLVRTRCAIDFSRWPGAALAFGVMLLSRCGPRNMPGTALGTYAISGTSAQNTCGSGTDMPNPWTFSIELSNDGSTLYWRQSGVTVSGTLDATSTARISAGITSQVVEADAASPGCRMVRSDLITITLAADRNTVSGTLAFDFSIVDGSDCSSQLSSGGGTYDALPCNLGYSFTGKRTTMP